jgi:Hint domain
MGNIAMSSDTQDVDAKVKRTRRNIAKMGVILATVAVAKAHAASPVVCRTPARFLCNCFLKGTNIQTAHGNRKVEDLAIGDTLPTMFGGMARIQWIARYSLKKSDPSKPWLKDAMPVRIARSAVAPGVPQADLYVTGDHALFVDGLLISIGNLINDTTITRHEARNHELEFFNIKLERQDVIYAEGAPVETLLDVDERASNFAEYFRRYGTPKTPDIPCAPRVPYCGARGELRSRLRSAISPFFDRREPVDVIRDRLEERGLALSRQLEPVS